MNALPSFVQLMESLGLSQENEYAGRDASRRDGPGAPPSSFLQFANPFESSHASIHEGRRNSSANLNPAMMSGHDILCAARERRGSSGSARSARYTPYSPSVSFPSVSTFLQPLCCALFFACATFVFLTVFDPFSLVGPPCQNLPSPLTSTNLFG